MRYATLAGALLWFISPRRAGAGAAPRRRPPTRSAARPKLVQNAAQSMLKDLDSDRDGYRKDPAKVERARRQVPAAALRHGVSPRAWCSGKHWRTATPEQRKRFVDAFYHSLLQQLRHRRSSISPATG